MGREREEFLSVPVVTTEINKRLPILGVLLYSRKRSKYRSIQYLDRYFRLQVVSDSHQGLDLPIVLTDNIMLWWRARARADDIGIRVHFEMPWVEEYDQIHVLIGSTELGQMHVWLLNCAILGNQAYGEKHLGY